MGFGEIQKIAESRYSSAVSAVRERFPYRLPRGYPSWNLLSAIAGIMLASDPSKAPDHGTGLHCFLWQAWLRGYPLYCLSTELLRQFEQTDTDGLAALISEDWQPPAPLFLLALPENAIVSPYGHSVAYVLVCIQTPELPQLILTEHPRQISISFTDSNETVWVSGTGFSDNQIIRARNELGGAPTSNEDHQWLAEIFAIALQCALALTYLPELVEDHQAVPAQGKPHKPGSKKPVLYPRWIGRNFERPRMLGTTTRGHHRSPIAHWRRGHWRRQVCGEGRQDRRLQWIRPTLIQAKN
jgi:hypothetical protein